MSSSTKDGVVREDKSLKKRAELRLTFDLVETAIGENFDELVEHEVVLKVVLLCAVRQPEFEHSQELLLKIGLRGADLGDLALRYFDLPGDLLPARSSSVGDQL